MHLHLNESEKLNIVLSLLHEKNDASHKMRERSLNFAIWILGFGIAVIWFLIKDAALNFWQKVVLTTLVISVGFISQFFLKSIENGFINNRKIMIDIEEVLGLHKKDLYIVGKSLYPEEYKKSSVARNSHFFSIYRLLLSIGIVIIILIWIN